jgi:hypothetical protein
VAKYGSWSWGLKDRITWSINAHILCSYDDVRKTDPLEKRFDKLNVLSYLGVEVFAFAGRREWRFIAIKRSTK